jgi:ketosteroid isomerase-like protein
MVAFIPTTQTGTDFNEFLQRCHDALTSQTHGDSAPYLSLWSRADDVVFLAPMGGYQLGYAEVSGLLAAVATTLSYEHWHADNLVTVINGDTAHTVEIEHISRKPDPARVSDWPDDLALRVTTGYRREHGEWKVMLRHANAHEDLNFPLYTNPRLKDSGE